MGKRPENRSDFECKKENAKKLKKCWTIKLPSCILNSGHFGEVPKLAEGAPLERE